MGGGFGERGAGVQSAAALRFASLVRPAARIAFAFTLAISRVSEIWIGIVAIILFAVLPSLSTFVGLGRPRRAKR